MRQLKIQKSYTNRESLSLDRYLQEIGHEELLTVDQEVELARRGRMGDEEAINKLVRCNLRFVVSVAKQYQNQGLTLSDLINEGNIGLMKAARMFDETRGFKFISYAVWWIRQAILQSLAEHSRLVRLPLNQVGSLSRISKASAQFEQQHLRRPSQDELSELLDVAPEKIDETLRASGRSVSVDAPFSEGDENTLLDVLVGDDEPAADDGLNHESLCMEVDRVLNQLTDRERQVIRMFYGIGGREYSLEEIGNKFNISRERVRQIKENAIRRLRGHKSDLLKAFLG